MDSEYPKKVFLFPHLTEVRAKLRHFRAGWIAANNKIISLKLVEGGSVNKKVLFLGAIGSGPLEMAKKQSQKGFWLFKRKSLRVSFNKGHALSLCEKEREAFCASEINRLKGELKVAASSGVLLIVEDFNLFFRFDQGALHWFLGQASNSDVDIYATASDLEEDSIALFDEVFLGRACSDGEFLFSKRKRAKLASGEFLHLDYRKCAI